MSSPSPVSSRVSFLLLGVSLALGFIVASDKLGKAIAQVKNSRPEVTVKGVAMQDTLADQGEMLLQLSWRGASVEAGRVAMSAQRVLLLEQVRTAGFVDSEIRIEVLQPSRFEPAGPKATTIDYAKYSRTNAPEFSFLQNFTVRSPKVDKVESLSLQEFAATHDVAVIRGAPVYRLLNLNDAKKELLEAAAKDAHRRAAILVGGSGSKVGALIEAAQGVFQVSAKNRHGDSDYGSVDSTAIEKTIRVVVTMRFEIIKE